MGILRFTGPTVSRFYTILYKGLKHSWILVFMGVLEPIPERYRAPTIVKFKGVKSYRTGGEGVGASNPGVAPRANSNNKKSKQQKGRFPITIWLYSPGMPTVKSSGALTHTQMVSSNATYIVYLIIYVFWIQVRLLSCVT